MTTVAQPAKQPNITARLWALFDQVGVEALPLNFAQTLAEAEWAEPHERRHRLPPLVRCAAVPVEQRAA